MLQKLQKQKYTKVYTLGMYENNKIKVEVSLDFSKGLDKPVFSCSGSIGEIIGGQCIDTIVDEYFSYVDSSYNRKTLIMINYLWDKYHLNDLNAGTLKQEQALKNWKERPNGFSYTEDCKYLESIGLLEDDGYKYGNSWLYREIPKKELELMKELVEIQFLR